MAWYFIAILLLCLPTFALGIVTPEGCIAQLSSNNTFKLCCKKIFVIS